MLRTKTPREQFNEKIKTENKHVVMFSGGVSSFESARRILAAGINDVELWFADTLTEDEDLYRFIEDCELYLGVSVVRVCDGRDIWTLFDQQRIIGNTQMDVCSRILKREILRKKLNKLDPQTTTVVFGLDWTEPHRIEKVAASHYPYRCCFPLTEKPLLFKNQLVDFVESLGITPPRLTKMGFPHNNCGGFCIKAGHAQFAQLLRVFPERYAYHEKREEEWQMKIGKNNTVLKERRGGQTKPLSLKEFRSRVECGLFDKSDWGGCGCFLGE